MPKIEEIFFRLLQLSAGKQVDFPALSEDEWLQVYELARRHALLGVIFKGIESLPDGKWPPKHLSIREYTQVKYVRKRNSDLNSLSVMVSDRLASDGIRCVLLKGQGVGMLYPDPSLRSGGDVDVWSDSPRTRLISYARTQKPDSKVFYHHTDMKSAGRYGVELHFTPTWMNSPFANRRLQNFFAERKEAQFANRVGLAEGTVAVPTADFNRVFLMVHMFRHLFSEGIGLRQVMDYYFLLSSGITAEERKDTMGVLSSIGLAPFSAAVMYVLQTVFGMDEGALLIPADRRRGEVLLAEIMRAGNFGQFDDSFRHDGIGKVVRSLRFLGQYPSEVLWAPLFKLWQLIFIRMKYNRV